MKASKALKRLAKVDALLSDVMERYTAPLVRGPLEEAKAAVARAREVVNSKQPAAPKKKASAAKPKKKSAKKATAPARAAAVANA